MSKDKPNIRENRRSPIMTLKEKRAMKRSKRHLCTDAAKVQVKQ